MVRQAEKHYSVKRRNKTILITKDELKALNLRLVKEFKEATPERRSEILSEYYDMNKPFVTYFPMFHGDYREEIINTFVTKIPAFFLAFDPKRNIDVNSYLSMFCKKNAVREFLFLHTTVQYNKFVKDEHGHAKVEKAYVISMDHQNRSNGANGVGDEYDQMDKILGDHVYDEFLNGNDDAAETFLHGVGSYKRYFSGLSAEIVEGFESGLRWEEVMEQSGLTTDHFLSTMAAIRMQLTRIMKKEGRDVRFIPKGERAEIRDRRKAKRREAVARENRIAASSGILGDGSIQEPVRGVNPRPDGIPERYGREAEEPRAEATDPLEDIWGGFEEGGQA